MHSQSYLYSPCQPIVPSQLLLFHTVQLMQGESSTPNVGALLFCTTNIVEVRWLICFMAHTIIKIRLVTVSRPRHYTVHQEIGSLGPKDQLWGIVGNAKATRNLQPWGHLDLRINFRFHVHTHFDSRS